MTDRRFAATGRLLGPPALERLSRAHAVVAGMGGVGSWAAEALVRTGVGAITIIDLDHIAESNVNRQVHALEATLGAAKVDVMGQRLHQMQRAPAAHLGQRQEVGAVGVGGRCVQARQMHHPPQVGAHLCQQAAVVVGCLRVNLPRIRPHLGKPRRREGQHASLTNSSQTLLKGLTDTSAVAKN